MTERKKLVKGKDIKSNKVLKRKINIGIVILGLLLLIFIIFLLKNNYKILKTGNNMSNKSIEEIEKYILNIGSYEATIQVTIESNKNTNRYVLNQKYVSPNQSKQIVLEPANIEGLEIVYDGQNLHVNNTKLNLSKIYENYEYIADNFLSLESFIEDYNHCKKEGKNRLSEDEKEYILEAELNRSKYVYIKKLYISKETGKPTQMLIEDINEKTIVYILYNEININDLRLI